MYSRTLIAVLFGIILVCTASAAHAQDSTAPTWTDAPHDLSFYNDAAWSVQWNASDETLIDVYFLNDTDNFYISPMTGEMTNKTTATGNYSVNLSVNDTSNNVLSAIITVELKANTTDSEPPTWNETPYDLSFFNNTAWSVQWNATDNAAIDKYYINDTGNFRISDSGILSNKTSIPGNYSVTVSANDTSGNQISSTINIEIKEFYVDTVPPNITDISPANGSTLSTGSNVNFAFITSEEVNGNITLDNVYTQDIASGTSFSLTLNGTMNASDIADGILSNGAHNVTVRVSDLSGNPTVKIYRFTVSDNTPPAIDSISISGTSSGSSTGTALITITTSEYAYCWISTNASINASSGTSMADYGAIAMTPSLGMTLSHSIDFSADGTLPARYISCADALWNNMTAANTTGDMAVSVTESSGGGHGGGGRGGGGGSSGSGSGSGNIGVDAGRNRTVVMTRGGAVISIPIVAAKSRSNSSLLSIIGFDVRYLDFNAKRKLSNIQLKLSLADLGDDSPLGLVYQGFRIDLVNFTDDDINETRMTLDVSKQWLTDNRINLSTLRLYRKESKWLFYELERIGETQSSIEYQASPPGFSLFAIIGEQLPPVASTPGLDSSKKLITSPKVEVIRNDSAIIDTNGMMDYTWIIVLGILAAAGSTLYFLRRRQLIIGEASSGDVVLRRKK